MASENWDEELEGVSEAEREEAKLLAESLEKSAEKGGAESRAARVLENYGRASLEADVLARGRARLVADLEETAAKREVGGVVLSLFARRTPLLVGGLAAAAALILGFGLERSRSSPAEESASYVLVKTHGEAAKRLANEQSRYLAEAMKPGTRETGTEVSLDESLRDYRIELIASYEAGR